MAPCKHMPETKYDAAERPFSPKLEAQKILYQRLVELNTHTAAKAGVIVAAAGR